MNRKEFLKRCQDVARNPDLIVIKCSEKPNNALLSYDNINYYGAGYMLKFDPQGNAEHTAILHDLKANSIIFVDLAKVEPAK